jgi:CO/xanthine dehydrogenase FAD-binding subunit
VTYHTPQTLTQALAHLAQAGSVAVVSGGTDYFPALRKGQDTDAVLDITGITKLRGITRDADGWRIGAVTTWSDIIHADLPPVFDALKAAAREVGSVQIQNVGTLGGNLCNASPAADGVPPLLTLDARVEISGPHGTRQTPLSEFLQGVRKTTLSEGELLTAILIPPQSDVYVSAFEKLGSRRYLVISITITSVALEISDGVIGSARVAVGACSAVAQRQPALERDLIGQSAASVVISPDMLENLAPIEDVRGDPGYRMLAAAAQCQRAIRRLAAL